jgi:4-hydroxy-tetrahydrodipicolinate reductase
MKKITIIGAAGRMGRRLVACVNNDPETELVAAVETKDSKHIGHDAGHISGVGNISVEIAHDLNAAAKVADAIIDFSSAESTIENLEIAVENGTAMVIGTTGLSNGQKVSIKRLAEKVPVVMAPNMSVGVNLMWRLIEEAAQVLQDDYDVEIIEAHAFRGGSSRSPGSRS